MEVANSKQNSNHLHRVFFKSNLKYSIKYCDNPKRFTFKTLVSPQAKATWLTFLPHGMSFESTIVFSFQKQQKTLSSLWSGCVIDQVFVLPHLRIFYQRIPLKIKANLQILLPNNLIKFHSPYFNMECDKYQR